MKWVDETVPDSMRAWSWASRTFLVFGESAETRPFLRRRVTGSSGILLSRDPSLNSSLISII